MEIMDKEISKLKSKPAEVPLVLEGFLRRITEIKPFLQIIKKHGYHIKAIIFINPSLDKAHKRCGSRLFCINCRKYYDELIPPQKRGVCDNDGYRLKKDIISISDLRVEFSEYFKELAPVIKHLQQISEIYFDVSGDDDSMVVFSNILIKLKSKIKQNYKIYERRSSSKLETKYGVFKMFTYQSKIDYSFNLTLVKGDVSNLDNVLVRVHSSCITGDIFGSLKCDCGDQLAESMKIIQEKKEGVIIYLFQEGRGINIINKIKSYKLQQQGLDTVEANEALGFPPEMRTYTAVRDILEDLKIKSINLLTNNPDKVNKLTELGIIVQGVENIEVDPNTHNLKYLQTKKIKMDHELKNIK